MMKKTEINRKKCLLEIHLKMEKEWPGKLEIK